jgi:hypothetical protein
MKKHDVKVKMERARMGTGDVDITARASGTVKVTCSSCPTRYAIFPSNHSSANSNTTTFVGCNSLAVIKCLHRPTDCEVLQARLLLHPSG